MEKYTTGTGQSIMVHETQFCSALRGESRWCVIHQPNPLHASWPTNWRQDSGAMEILCPHGIGHPVRAVPPRPGWDIHGCDGCCVPDTFRRNDTMENSKPLVRTGAPGDEQTYQVRQGGLMRCCLSTLANYHVHAEFGILGHPMEGQILGCRSCSSSMVFIEGAWEWNKGKTDYRLRG